MRKLIIIFSIMLLCVGLFGCSASGDLKISSTLELKDEYRNDVSVNFMDNFNQTVVKYVELYNQKEPLVVTDLKPLLNIKLPSNKVEGALSDTERLLLGKSTKVLARLISECDTPTEEKRIDLKENIQVLLDYYK